MKHKYVTIAQIAERVGKSERWVHSQLLAGNKIEVVKSAVKLGSGRTSPWLITANKKFFEES